MLQDYRLELSLHNLLELNANLDTKPQFKIRDMTADFLNKDLTPRLFNNKIDVRIRRVGRISKTAHEHCWIILGTRLFFQLLAFNQTGWGEISYHSLPALTK